MSVFDIIRESVEMKDVARKYGLTIKHSGFATCPFHTEKTASLKIYNNGKGWHCYGCGAGGSVIDFVMRFFNTGKAEAIKIINSDFSLNLPLKHNSTWREREMLRRRMREAEDRIANERKAFHAEKEEYNLLMDKYVWADIIIAALKPMTPEDEIYDIYKDAVNERMIIEYKLDCLGAIK